VLRDGGRLLRAALQLPGLLRPVPQHLDRIQDVRSLRQDGIADLLRPVELLVHRLEHVGEGDEGLHAGVPGLRLQRLRERLRPQQRVALAAEPALGAWRSSAERRRARPGSSVSSLAHRRM
jgi:hypothetical protein